ncbi:PAS domain-containing protein [Ralstonia sp. SET104]|uniref:PAS domain-containing protein n=1 Tax=Ralstonia sp. SET104 TaxID=2448774 RepID=UPI0035B56EF1
MDNTARKLVERRLQRQQARFKAVLQLSREGMALLDPELRCESANDALAQMLGYQLQTLEGMDFPALFVDGGARLRKALRGRQKADFISALKGADGEALDVSVRVLIDRDEDGVSEYCVVAVQAI